MNKEDFLNKWIDSLPLNSKDSDRKEMEYDLEQLQQEQDGKTEQLSAEEFLKSKNVCKEEQILGYVLKFDELTDLLEEYSKQSNWISVDNPPKPVFRTEGKLRLLEIQNVIATDGESVFDETYDPSEGFHESITHWQPLPQPPKQ